MSFSLNVKEQIFIGVAILILIMVVFGIFVFKPQYDRFNDARSRQEKEIQEQNSKEAELATYKAAKSDAASTEAKSLELNKRMPEEADLPSILVELDSLGSETNVKVLDITPSQLMPADGYSILPIKLKIVGTYFNVSDFLYKIVKSSREFTVSDVNLDIAVDGYPLLSGDIDINAFVYSTETVSTSSSNSTNTQTPVSTQNGGQQ